MSNRTRASVIRGGSQTYGSAFSDAITTFDAETTATLADPARAAEAARSLAYEQGYNAGLEQARADVEAATDDANRRVRRALGALTIAIEEFQVREATALHDVEDEIVRAAFEIARSVLARELRVAEDPGAEAIARAIGLLPGRDSALVRLSPEDAATLNINRVDAGGRQIEVIADPAVESGGCVVESGNTTIDAQLSSVLAKVAQVLGL